MNEVINKNYKFTNIDIDNDTMNNRYNDEGSEQEDNNNSNNKRYKIDIINKKNNYICPSDSSDSEYDDCELENENIFAINLLEKKYRHNKRESCNKIANLFNSQILKMECVLNENKNNNDKVTNKKNNNLKKNIDACKKLEINLKYDINFFKTKFRMIDFIENIREKIDNNYEKKRNLDFDFEKLYEKDNIKDISVIKFFKNLNSNQKNFYYEKLKEIKKIDNINKPLFIKVLESNIKDSNKTIILQKLQLLENLKNSSEGCKLKNWITKVMKIPFEIILAPTITKYDSVDKIREYFNKIRDNLDSEIYGHETTKDQLMKIMAHTITNPKEGGNIFALVGPPGVGKTALIQDGIAKALLRPFSFISLGGATDACFLEGHDYTYEGSNPVKIVEILQKAECMNPIIYFDELDKISNTSKGEEIINILMHITDSTQNSHFNDKYFGGIDIDLSKAIIIFSFNDVNKISKILLDRMKIIRVKGYKLNDKINIGRDYLIPKLLKQIGLEDIKVEFSDLIIEYIIENYTNEGGVRKLKEIINDILLEINLRKLEDNKLNEKKIKDKIKISVEILENDLLKKKNKFEILKINKEPHVGVVNGLWANEYGVGGLVPIECCWIPSSDKLQLELTGMQGKVMKESMSVARTIAWRILPDEIKEKLNLKWKETFEYGIHIHCPDGSTPKDGPSAGGAITTCLISLLTDIKVNNKVAMTGEINLKGKIRT